MAAVERGDMAEEDTVMEREVAGSGAGVPASESQSPAVDMKKYPIQTQQLLATMSDDARPECSPFGTQGNIDIVIGCSTDDIIKKMRVTEQPRVPASGTAKHLGVRRILVDWICEVCEAFRLQKCTAHVAVGYLDRILQDVAVAKNRLQLVAICCVLIAAKYEEAEENVPAVPVMAEYSHNTYPPAMIHQMEIMVLTRLNWSLTVVTPLHYLGYYLEKGMVFTTDTMQGVRLIPKVPRYVKKYVEFFADLTLQEYEFQAYPPSKLAAAIVAAARRALSIRPLWCHALTDLVGYSQVDIADVFSHVWKYYLECFPSEGTAADKSHDESPTTATNVTATDDELNAK